MDLDKSLRWSSQSIVEKKRDVLDLGLPHDSWTLSNNTAQLKYAYILIIFLYTPSYPIGLIITFELSPDLH